MNIKRNKGAMIILTGLLFIYGCDGAECPDSGCAPTPDQLEAMVIDNCRILEAAVEEFAAQNTYNEYPTHLLTDSTSTGLALIDFLPEGQRLVNPFTGKRSEPVERRASGHGEIGLEEYDCCGFCVGYIITGFGWDSVIVELSNLDELEEQVIANCLIVQEAAEEYARQNDGVYAGDIDVDTTPGGDTIVDLLPGGVLLENPFTKCACTPVNGAPCGYGETGYEPIVGAAGINAGYEISGTGRDYRQIIIRLSNVDYPEDASVISNCLMLREYVGWFANRNNDIYPADLTTDTDLDGNTIMDWIGGSGMRNPYNPDLTNPIDGRASNPGETGYEPVIEGDIVVDFFIAGVGATADSLIVELTSNTVTYR